MSDKFTIAETGEFSRFRNRQEYEKLFKKIDYSIYDQLQENPFEGRNIKKLKDEFKNIYRYRAGYFRIFYIIDKKAKIIIMISIQHRKNAYKRK